MTAAATTHAEVLAGLAALEDREIWAERLWQAEKDANPYGAFARDPVKNIYRAQADVVLNTLRASIDLARLVATEHEPDGLICTLHDGPDPIWPCPSYRSAALVAGVDLTAAATSTTATGADDVGGGL